MRLDIALLMIASTVAPFALAAQPARSSILTTYEGASQPPASEVTGQVVALDTEKKTLTLKTPAGDDSPGEWELSVEGDGLAALPALMPGDHVTVACREGTSTDKCVVTTITKREPK